MSLLYDKQEERKINKIKKEVGLPIEDKYAWVTKDMPGQSGKIETAKLAVGDKGRSLDYGTAPKRPYTSDSGLELYAQASGGPAKPWQSVEPDTTFFDMPDYVNSSGQRIDPVDGSVYRKASLVDLIVGSAKKGYYQNQLGEESYREMMGQENDAQQIREYLDGDEFEYIPQGWLQQAVAGGDGKHWRVGGDL